MRNKLGKIAGIARMVTLGVLAILLIKSIIELNYWTIILTSIALLLAWLEYYTPPRA
ncbi:hypothetical protein D3C87_1981490 [compost metagenome]